MRVTPAALLAVTLAPGAPLPAAPARFEARFVLPPQDQHVHSSSIVELPGGGLFAVWYQGSGERRADDVRLQRARLSAWVSRDEGRSWPRRRALEDAPGGSYSYPSVVEAKDGLVHVSYSHADAEPAGTKRRAAIKHVAFDAAWVAAAE